MTIIMNRKAAEFWWNFPINGVQREPFKCQPDIAYYVRDPGKEWKSITWRDIHEKRTVRIRRNIEMKRLCDIEEVKPCLIWVFFVGSRLMGGYYTIVKTLHKEWYLNFRDHGLSRYITAKELQQQVMEVFPLCLPLPDLFDVWMRLFAKRYHNPHFNKYRNIQGTAIAWCKLDRSGSLIAVSSAKKKL